MVALRPRPHWESLQRSPRPLAAGGEGTRCSWPYGPSVFGPWPPRSCSKTSTVDSYVMNSGRVSAESDTSHRKVSHSSCTVICVFFWWFVLSWFLLCFFLNLSLILSGVFVCWCDSTTVVTKATTTTGATQATLLHHRTACRTWLLATVDSIPVMGTSWLFKAHEIPVHFICLRMFLPSVFWNWLLGSVRVFGTVRLEKLIRCLCREESSQCFQLVCLSVCLSVNKITQKVVYWFSWNCGWIP